MRLLLMPTSFLQAVAFVAQPHASHYYFAELYNWFLRVKAHRHGHFGDENTSSFRA